MEIKYISIDPRLIEARIEELETEKEEAMIQYQQTNKSKEQDVLSMKIVWIMLFIKELKFIIGQK